MSATTNKSKPLTPLQKERKDFIDKLMEVLQPRFDQGNISDLKQTDTGATYTRGKFLYDVKFTTSKSMVLGCKGTTVTIGFPSRTYSLTEEAITEMEDKATGIVN